MKRRCQQDCAGCLSKVQRQPLLQTAVPSKHCSYAMYMILASVGSTRKCPLWCMGRSSHSCHCTCLVACFHQRIQDGSDAWPRLALLQKCSCRLKTCFLTALASFLSCPLHAADLSRRSWPRYTGAEFSPSWEHAFPAACRLLSLPRLLASHCCFPSCLRATQGAGAPGAP